MIDSIFKPTRSKCGLGRNFRLFRNNEWTSNGYWAMKTSLEPKMISELKDTVQLDSDISKIAKEFNFVDCKELKLTSEIRIIGNDLAVKLKAETFNVWVRPHYLTLLRKATRFSDIYSKGNLSTIFFVDHDQVLGVVMPIRVNEEAL